MSRSGVSVVVPVYNPGRYFDRTITSLLHQTLPRDRYELVFVDDGSTDGTGARLDELAARHPALVQVKHIPNSGWAGRPRNLGTDLAKFDYVFYCDADDWLPEYALEALLERAETDQSDLVVSRVTGNRRAVPQVIFERGDFCTTWRETPAVFTNLTTQKLFRREFLREHGMRFAEGRVRLEDFIFMTQALLEAERVSVLGSRPCYVLEKRDDAGNLTASAVDVDGYFASVETILDIIEARTEPGRDRDLALDRVLRGEIVHQVIGPGFVRKDAAERAAVFGHVQRLLRERIPDSAVARMNAMSRRKVRAIVAGQQPLIEHWIEWDAAVTPEIRYTSAEWTDGTLRLGLEFAFLRAGAPVTLTRVGERLFLPGPPGLEPDEPGLPAGVDVTAEARTASCHLALRSQDISESWRVRAAVEYAAGARQNATVELRFVATAEVDFRTLADGRPPRPEVWEPYVQIGCCGMGRERRAGFADAVRVPVPAVLDGLVVSPYLTKKDEVVFDVAEASRPLPAELARRGLAPAELTRAGLSLTLPLVVVGSEPRFGVELVPRGRRRTGPITLPAVPATGSAPASLQIPIPDLSGAQRWSVRLRHNAADQVIPIGYDIVPPRRGAVWQRTVPGTLVPAKEDMIDKARSADRRPLSWRRRVVRIAERFGLRVSRVGSGALLVSRAEQEYETEPLVRDKVYLVGNQRGGRSLLPLKSGVALVATGDGPPLKLSGAPVGEDTWLVGTSGANGSGPDIVRIGKNAALVAAPDPAPRAALTLETETMQHLGERHVPWLLERYQVDCVIDVGANNGQYAQRLRRNGYQGHIVSVEPVPAFVEKVRQLSANDPKWTVHQIALGETDGVVPIQVQRTFSSALPASDYGKQRFATLREFADTEPIEVPLRRLDSVLDEWLAPIRASGVDKPRVFLKMDTQGLDLQVFAGLGSRVSDVVGLQSEVALLLIYENMPRMPQAIATYEAAGFEITGLYPVTREPDGRVIEYDCTMVRASALPAS